VVPAKTISELSVNTPANIKRLGLTPAMFSSPVEQGALPVLGGAATGAQVSQVGATEQNFTLAHRYD